MEHIREYEQKLLQVSILGAVPYMQYASEPHDSEVSFHCHIEILGKLMPAILF